MLRDQLEEVRERIARAAQRVGRPASSVQLVAVTKQVPVEMMRQAVALGVTDLGENRVQEARRKQSELASEATRISWHLIGHLQRNKAKLAVELFDVVHSVDSRELAEDLERRAAACGRTLDVFLQVNVAGETTKSGCRSDEANTLARAITTLPHVRLVGLMTIAPFADDVEATRPVFRQLRVLRDAMASTLTPATVPLKLSMGMSHDFEVAIEEGADVVRIGTAIFGVRG